MVQKRDKGKHRTFWVILAFVGVLALVLVASDNLRPTGRISFDVVGGIYSPGEDIGGKLNIDIIGGELIPEDSTIVIELNGMTKEVLFSKVVSGDNKEGIFYAQGAEITGSGKGYGTPGTKVTYPDVAFQFSISRRSTNVADSTNPDSKPDISASARGGGGSSDVDLGGSGDSIDSGDSIGSGDESGDSGDSVSSGDSGSSPSPSPSPGAGAGITGSAIIDGKVVISAVVNSENPFNYQLAEGESVEIISGSVKANGLEIEDGSISVRRIGDKIVVETDYSEEEEGFGRDYLDGKKKLTLSIDLREFDLMAEKGANSIDVALVYQGQILAQARKEIIVKGDQEIVPDEDVGYNVEVVQHKAVLGQPVKWSETYKFSSNPADKVVVDFSDDIDDAKVVEVVKRKESGEDAPDVSISVSKKGRNVKVVDENNQEENVDVEVIEPQKSLTGEVTVNLELNKESNVLENFVLFLKGLFVPTGRAIEEVDAGTTELIEEVTVEYVTDAPYAIEEERKDDKVVEIIGPDEVHYQDVLAFTTIPEKFNVRNPASVKVYWQENDQYLSTEVVEDTNDNGVYDYVEWIAPSLSNQTFIIEIINAEHLDSNRDLISDIYEEVKALDGVWSETIPDGDYVRVVFEQNLTNGNDITIYPRTIAGNPRIDIYEFNENKIINSFETIADNQYNKVYLTGLEGEQDTFDLRISGGDVEFDHIIDPIDEAPTIDFVSPTPANGETVTTDNIYVSVASADDLTDHYAFNDFNSDLVLWVTMDDVDGSGNPLDLSTYGNNGTKQGDAVQTPSGAFGDRFDFDGSGDYVALNGDPSIIGFDLNSRFTVSAWVRSVDLVSNRQIVSDSNPSGVGWAIYQDSAGTLKFEVSNGTTTASCSPEETLTVNNWYFFYGRYNGSAASCGLNGVDLTPIAYTGNSFSNAVGVSIGSIHATSAVRSWNGSIDDVLIFNRSLSNAELDSIFNATSTQYANNFTSLNNATYTFKAYAVDNAGNANETEQRSVTVNVSGPSFFNINTCVPITVPNRIYNVTGNIIVSELQIAPCINILAQNTTVQGNGFQIGRSSFTEALVYSNQNFTNISNLVLNRSTSLSSTGEITLANASHSDIRGVTFSTGNIGIVLENTHYSTFDGNTFVTSDRGLNTIITSNNNVFSNSQVSGANYGIVITGNNNVVNNSNLTSSVINALYVTGSSNVFENLVINDTSQTAIYLSSGNGNIFDSVNMAGTNPSYYDIDFVSSNNTEIRDTAFGRYALNSVGAVLKFVETGVGEIQYLEHVNGTEENLSEDVSISLNLANVSNNPGLNESANITLYGLATNYSNPFVIRDGFVCPPIICPNYTSLNAGTVRFKAPSFSSYSIGDLPVCTDLASCTTGGVCIIQQDCRLNTDLCSGGECMFTNITFNGDIYTGHNASLDGGSLILNITGQILFSSGKGIIFNGKDNNPLGGSTEDGGNAGTVNITMPPTGLFNRTNAYFDGSGGDANDLNGRGGTLQLNYHGLLGSTSSWTADVSGGTGGSGGGGEGSIIYNKYLTPCPVDADIDNSGTVVLADIVTVRNRYNNVSTDADFNSAHDINCDNKLNVIELAKIGFEFSRGV